MTIELPEATILRLQPGDTVVLRSDKRLTPTEAMEIKDLARQYWPDNEVAVLNAGMTIEVVRADVGPEVALPAEPQEEEEH